MKNNEHSVNGGDESEFNMDINKQKLVNLAHDLDMRLARVKDFGLTEDLWNDPKKEIADEERIIKQKEQELLSELENSLNVPSEYLVDIWHGTKENDALDELADYGREKFDKARDEYLKFQNDLITSDTEKLILRKYKKAARLYENMQKYYIGDDGREVLGLLLASDNSEEAQSEQRERQWFYENLLTKEEQQLIDKLRETKVEITEEDKRSIFEKAREKTASEVRAIIPETRENWEGFESGLKEIEAVEKRDDELFGNVEKKMAACCRKEAWTDLHLDIAKFKEKSEKDLIAYRNNKKGFGEKASAKVMKRLRVGAKKIRRNADIIYKSLNVELASGVNVLKDVLKEESRLRKGLIAFEEVVKKDEVGDDLYGLLEHMYSEEKDSMKNVLSKIDDFEKGSWVDMDPASEEEIKLQKTADYVEKGRRMKLENLRIEMLEAKKKLKDIYRQIYTDMKVYPVN